MKYPYPKHRIDEIIKSPKSVRENEVFETNRKGARGAFFDVNIDLKVGDFTDMRYLGKAHDVAVVDGYEAAFLLSAHRVRGVGFSPVGRRRFYKEHVPAGWHQNILNPNLPTNHSEHNRHEKIINFEPIDFQDFIHKTSKLWNVELDIEKTMLRGEMCHRFILMKFEKSF